VYMHRDGRHVYTNDYTVCVNGNREQPPSAICSMFTGLRYRICKRHAFTNIVADQSKVECKALYRVSRHREKL